MLEAIVDGRTDLVLEWVAAGNPPDATDAHGVSLAQWCAYYGDVSALDFLRRKGIALTGLGHDLGLNGAAFHGHWQLCQYLIEHGADPNSVLEDTRETPLHSALCKFESPAHERVVEVLVASGGRVDAVTAVGVETGCFMRDIRTRGETPLHRAGAFGTLHAIELLLGAGGARETRDANGDTPLTWACWALRATPVMQLLCYGPYRIRDGYRGMAENLLGRTRPGGVAT